MSDCVLPIAGGNTMGLVLLAALALGIGIPLLVIVRRRGVGRAATILVALAVAGTALWVVDARRADAATCPSTTTAVPTTIGVAPATTVAATTTTAAPSTTVAATTTTAAATTTTAATATTTPPPTTTAPATTTTTTTTVPLVADLMPTISGPTTAVPGVRGTYTLTIANVGAGPTSGQMTFTLAFTLQTGSSPLAAEALASTDWTLVSSSGGSLTYQSNAGFTLAPGAVSTTTFGVTWSSTLPVPGSFTIATSLPAGIGGETNAANNAASITVVVSAP